MECSFTAVPFAALPPLDHVQLALCNRYSASVFWRCLGSKLWYQPNTRVVRKLCLNLSALGRYSEPLNELTHLHVSDNDHVNHVRSIVLPPNLTYCCLEPSKCLFQCTLPMSLTFLETRESCLELVHLNNHPNLTVLRILKYDQCMSMLPQNLTELELNGTSQIFTSFPNSLKRLTLVRCLLASLPIFPNLVDLNIQDSMDNVGADWSRNLPNTLQTLTILNTRIPIQALPKSLVRLVLKSYNTNNISLDEPCENVREFSFCVYATTKTLTPISQLFPAVQDLKISFQEAYGFDIPVFDNVRKLNLHVMNPQQLYRTSALSEWQSLRHLELNVDGYEGNSELFQTVTLPHLLSSLKIANHSPVRLQIAIPPLVTRLTLTSYRPTFDVIFAENSKLHTLLTNGNVFARKITVPDSLQVFYVYLGHNDSLVESWNTLPTGVDFQVFH